MVEESQSIRQSFMKYKLFIDSRTKRFHCSSKVKEKTEKVPSNECVKFTVLLSDSL